MPVLDKLQERYEKLLNKCNPENFKEDENKHNAAIKRTNLLHSGYKYLEEILSEEQDS